MTTVANIIDRVFRQYLEPPSAQPAICYTATALDASQDDVTLTAFETVEDQDLLRQGVILELGSELVKIKTYNPTSAAATIRRGQLGSTATIHSTDTQVKLAPEFTRMDAFSAVAENMMILGAKLFTTRTDYVSFSDGAASIDPLAVSIIRFRPDNPNDVDLSESMEIVDYHPAVGGRAVTSQHWVSGYVTYRCRLGVPTVESDTTESLGLENVWIPALLAGVAGDVMAGRDIPETQFNWISQALEPEAVPFGSRLRLAGSLKQYQRFLITEFVNEMNREYRPTVRMLSPFGQGH